MGVGRERVGTGLTVGDTTTPGCGMGLGVDVEVEVGSGLGVTVGSGLSEQTASTSPAASNREESRAVRRKGPLPSGDGAVAGPGAAGR